MKRIEMEVEEMKITNDTHYDQMESLIFEAVALYCMEHKMYGYFQTDDITDFVKKFVNHKKQTSRE